jgi:hypothetical protein
MIWGNSPPRTSGKLSTRNRFEHVSVIKAEALLK